MSAVSLIPRRRIGGGGEMAGCFQKCTASWPGTPNSRLVMGSVLALCRSEAPPAMGQRLQLGFLIAGVTGDTSEE